MTQLLSRSLVLDEIDTLSKALHPLIKEKPRLFAFYGPLGAGKTTLIKTLIASFLDIDPSLITSPTFTYVNTYENRDVVHHFDLYRLKTVQAFEALGLSDYLDQTCFIEWPEIIEAILPDSTVRIHINYNDQGSREYKIGVC